MLYFAGRTGWLHTHRKIYEMRIGGLPLSWNGRITQNPFLGMKEASVDWSSLNEEKVARRRFLGGY